MLVDRAGLLTLVTSWNNEVEQYYEDQILNQKRLYSARSVSTVVCTLHLVKNSNAARHTYLRVSLYMYFSWSGVLHYLNADKDRISILSPDGKVS